MVRDDIVQIINTILTDRIKQDFNIDKQNPHFFNLDKTHEHIGLLNLIGFYDESYSLSHYRPKSKYETDYNDETQTHYKPFEFGTINLQYVENGVNIVTKLKCGEKLSFSIPNYVLANSNQTKQILGETFTY